VNPDLSYGLPAFLARKPGLQSGMMIAQVAAASLLNEAKVLAHPASVDNVPTSAGKEDHVSMGSISGRKLHQVIDNLEYILAIELLYAAQAVDFRRPLTSSPVLEAVHHFVRDTVSFATKDRIFAYDIQHLHTLITNQSLVNVANTAAADNHLSLNGIYHDQFRLS
jgi:histidine ammonia-lyase